MTRARTTSVRISKGSRLPRLTGQRSRSEFRRRSRRYTTDQIRSAHRANRLARPSEPAGRVRSAELAGVSKLLRATKFPSDRQENALGQAVSERLCRRKGGAQGRRLKPRSVGFLYTALRRRRPRSPSPARAEPSSARLAGSGTAGATALNWIVPW